MGRSLTLLKELKLDPNNPGSRLVIQLYDYLTKLGAVDPLAAISIMRNFSERIVTIGQALNEGQPAESTFLILDGRFITINSPLIEAGFFDTEEVEELDSLPEPPLLMSAISLNKLWLVG